MDLGIIFNVSITSMEVTYKMLKVHDHELHDDIHKF